MKKVMGLILLALFALMVGCHGPATSNYVTVMDAKTEVAGSYTLKSMEKSILTALYDLEWHAKKVGSQSIEATMFAKRPKFEQKLTILIDYTPHDITIYYKDSVYMQFDARDNTVVYFYKDLVDELTQHILDELGRINGAPLNPTVYEQDVPAN